MMPKSSKNTQNSENTKGPIFLEADELRSSVPIFYQAKGVTDKVREGMRKRRAKREERMETREEKREIKKREERNTR